LLLTRITGVKRVLGLAVFVVKQRNTKNERK